MVELASYRSDVYLDEGTFRSTLAEDVRQGLTGWPKSLPSKYFYDSTGSALFERITRLPEYYLTRVEESLIASIVPELMHRVRPREIVELWSGLSTKVRRFLDARNGSGPVARYLPFDVDVGSVEVSSADLIREYPYLEVHGLIGDFGRHLAHVPSPMGRRLVLFLGSTIGNLKPSERREFLVQIRRLLAPDDRLLLGLDLVKDPAVLEEAYNDPAGVTAEFNRNILGVVNRALHADFHQEAFRHYAFYNQEAGRIEMHLVSASVQVVNVRDSELTIQITPDESIWTESSYKFTKESTLAMLQEAGLGMEGWYTDGGGLFALALADPG